MGIDFTEKESEFLKKKFMLSKEEIVNLNDEEFDDFLIECALIEADEIMAAEEKNQLELSDRGNTITGIINKLCEWMKPDGDEYIDEDIDYDDESDNDFDDKDDDDD